MKFIVVSVFGLLFSTVLQAEAAGPLIITEVMPDNARTLLDEDGSFQDWIEIHNPTPAPVNLVGWYLTDHPAALTKWMFPATNLPSGGYLVVFASGKNRVTNPARLHTNFQLENSGEFLALVQPDGVTIASEFSPAFPAVKEDVSFGMAQRLISTQLLSDSIPRVLVPAGAAALPANWNARDYLPGSEWAAGFAPPALGFDTNQPPPAPSNLAPGGIAVQSTTLGTSTANLALNGILTDSTSTLNTDNDPFWQVTLAADAAIDRVVLRNRTTCCGSRLRDITVEILSADGATTNFTSALLNPENAGFTYPNGPSVLEVNLVTLIGASVPGRIIRVHRTPDPDLSGSGGQGTTDEAVVLALAEVEVMGISLGGSLSEVNLGRTGSPAPTATQSTTLSPFTAAMALNGNLADFTHTTGTDSNPSWTVNLGRSAVITSVTLHNRDSCCGSRLRDITVEILDAGGNIIYASALLNPENAGYSFPNGPDNLVLNLSPNPVVGHQVRVRRTPDLDLSGSGGQGNVDEAAVLSLGEVIVLGYDLNGYRPFVRTDLASSMLGQNASAFIRIPFSVSNPGVLTSLALRLRYDDGFVAYLNGVEVARRNAPAVPAWNSAATAARDLTSGILQENIDLGAFVTALVPGQNLLAFHAMNVAAGDGDLLVQPELVSTELSVTGNVYLSTATPGTINDSEFYFDEVKDTQFSVDRGFFEEPFSLEITSATPGALIYYSFNGDEPGPGKGNLYTGPLTITNTTVLRARAFKENWKATDVDSATYLFLADVIRQVPNWEQNNVPPEYFPATWGANAVDYGMDPQVINSYTPAQWKEALTQIPSMSIVTEMRHLFDATTGIYANASGHGEVWERPGSLELLDPSDSIPGKFQENCGLRIRGGASRGSSFRKHSLRVFFRREYGAGKLNFPLFENEGASEFDTFDLRTSQNYSWPRSGDSPAFETMVREVWARKTLGDMGQPYRRSRYYHLYINGQYWGLYETDERPEASFGETYFGGSKTNFDVVKCGNRGVTPTFATEATDGNLIAWSNLWVMTQIMRTNAINSNYFRILGRLPDGRPNANPDGTQNTNAPVMLDADNLIDYMIGIFYSGDGDATLSSFLGNNQPNNWYGMRDRSNPNVGFRFFNNDCEHTLGTPNSQVDRTGPFGGSNEGNFTFSNPQWMHEALMRNIEYRVRFWDHVQKHFFNGGALTIEACTNRFIAKANQITKAIRAYSARWGDAVTPTAPFGESHWTNAIQVALNWFPPRANIVLNQLIADNLYPTINAPVFSSYGGFVSPGAQVSMTQTNPAGTIYFTVDGSDPRLVGGNIAPAAQVYTGPVTLEGNALVQARVLVGTNWSAIVRGNFTTAQYFRDLAVTEIMYNPPGAINVDGDEFEFLEVKNTGTTTLNLSGLGFTSGITFTFTNNTRLAPGAFFVLARNASQFQAKYPGVALNGLYSGRIDNAGETLRLSHGVGGTVFALTYGDAAPWPLTPDGSGFTLVPVSLVTNFNSDNPIHWRASANPGGSPGADDPTPTIPPVLINEVLSHTFIGQDFIELFNPTGIAVDVGGWFLTDDKGTPQKFRIPAGMILPAGGSVVFTETDFNPTPGFGNSFSLNSVSDDVYVFSGGAASNLTGYSHGFMFGAAPDGGTFGRYIASTGEEQFPLQSGPTPGAANAGPAIGPVVLSEIHYNPRPGDISFVELKNISGAAVALFDGAAPTNTWRVNGIGFDVPPGVSIPAGGFIIVAASEPAAFRSRHNIPLNIPVYGPYAGGLQDSGERLELQRPDSRGTNGYAFVTVDEVRYNDRAPWPTAADGIGPSLQRLAPQAYGNDPINWRAAASTPGRDYVTGIIPTISQHPVNATTVATREATFSVTAAGPGPLSFQWRVNGNVIPGATNSLLLLTNLQLSQAGAYTAIVFNDAGAVESLPGILAVLVPANILQQPRDVLVRIKPDPQAAPATNATFTIQAASTSPIRYQWRFNGVPIDGATNFSLIVTNVQLDDAGQYSVEVTDSAGTIFSAPGNLYPLIVPGFAQLPVAQAVPVGSVVTLSTVVTGSPAPFTLEWRRGSAGVATNMIYGTQGFHTFVAPNYVTNFNYRVVVKNLANPTPGVPSPFSAIAVVTDSDGDGLPDGWETEHGLNPASSLDATGDRDGDGVSNGKEYDAGTDPNDPASFLSVALNVTSGAAVLSFGASSNKTYSVQFLDELSAAWQTLADVAARSSNRVETIPDSAANESRFYRVATPRQP